MKKFARVIVKGGILLLGELQKILTLCETLQLPYVHFGSRQDIVLPIYKIDKKIQAQSNLEITLIGWCF